MSFREAKQLGILKHGTARVRVRAIDTGRHDLAKYYLQLGAFNSKNTAKTFKDNLAKKLPITPYIETKLPFYLVKLGPIDSTKTLTQLKNLLRQQGVTSVISSLK